MNVYVNLVCIFIDYNSNQDDFFILIKKKGFYGDGYSCTAHFCSSDGDCGYNAHCLPDEQRPGFSKCVCDPGYLNDGTTFSTCVKDGKEITLKKKQYFSIYFFYSCFM